MWWLVDRLREHITEKAELHGGLYGKFLCWFQALQDLDEQKNKYRKLEDNSRSQADKFEQLQRKCLKLETDLKDKVFVDFFILFLVYRLSILSYAG